MAAEPTDEARLRLTQEVREIKEIVRLSAQRDRFVIHDLYAVRAGDLMQGLLDHTPTIVHFSGHGAGETGLCLEGLDGHAHLVSADALTALFEEFSATLQCVILNACYSEIQADGIVKAIRCVVGMRDAISDAAAIAYAKGFYQALGAGKQLHDAHRLGRVRIGLEVPTAAESRLPVLKVRQSGVEAEAMLALSRQRAS